MREIPFSTAAESKASISAGEPWPVAKTTSGRFDRIFQESVHLRQKSTAFIQIVDRGLRNTLSATPDKGLAGIGPGYGALRRRLAL